MTIEELRLECLKLACELEKNGRPAADTMNNARRFLDFVMEGMGPDELAAPRRRRIGLFGGET